MDYDIDFLIVGGGIAGLRAAITLASAGRVLILTKADATESNTGYAQGGIAAAMSDEDSPDLHAADTIRAADGLADEPAVRVLVEEGPRYVQELVDWGTRFDRTPAGRLSLGLEAVHSARRVLHAGDATGREIARALWAQAISLAEVRSVSHALVTELLIDGDAVCGARFFDQTGVVRQVRARATLLATGGAGQVFRETTNPSVATGDGVALAYHAGARLADLEFVQFHPTALIYPDAPRFLISEALRGEGAKLVNARGDAFMTRYHPDAELAPRDVVARSIVREADATGSSVFLTLAHLDAARVRSRFPGIAAMCASVGLDLANDLIPVGPAAHYLMGGIETDVWGRTSVRGLFAAGEAACTGVHGANRLASNSLLEGLVFGARAAEAMIQGGKASSDLRAGWKLAPPEAESGSSDERAMDVTEARDVMWRSVGLFRSGDGLRSAVGRLNSAYLQAGRAVQHAESEHWRSYNLIAVARLIARAALRREESRGGHFRDDFPSRNDLDWKVHLVDVKQN